VGRECRTHTRSPSAARDKMKEQIVIAWIEKGDGTPRRPDLAHAFLWHLRGNEDDIAKAHLYAGSTKCGGGGTARVYVYPTSERAPLVRARAEVARNAAVRGRR